MSNRFDSGSVSAYTPQSFQELAFTPMMKRQQHDEMSKNIAALDAIATDPLNEHRDEALRLKQEFEGKLGNISGELASKGIDGIGRENFYRLKKEHDDLIAPTGKIGQINAAKIDYNKQQDEFIKDAAKQNIGRDQALKLWAQKTGDYTGYSDPEKKQIINVTPQGVAAFQDFDKDILAAHSILGKYEKTLANSGYRIFPDKETGKLLFADKNGNLTTSTNIPQVDDALAAINEKWLKPTGEGRKWAEDAGLDLDNLKNQISNKFSSMIEKGYKDTRGENFSIPDVLNPKAETIDPGGMIISNDSTLTSDATDHPTYSNALETIKSLNNSKSLNPSDKAKLEDLTELRKNADSKLNKNPKYVELNNKVNSELKEWENIAKKFNLSDNEKRIVKDNPNLLPQLLFSKGIGSYKGSKNDPELKAIMDDSKLSKFNNLTKERQGYKDKAWKESSSLRHNYSYLPSTPKEESEWNLHNENVYNVLKGLPDISNVLDLTSVYTTSGTKKNITPDEVSNVQTLLKNGDPKSFKINNIKTYGDNKTPEITITFNTNKEASDYNMDRGLFSAGRSDEYGGAEKPVTITFKLKKFSNSFDTGSAAGYKNLSGAIGNFWKNKGGVNQITGNFQGAEVYNSMIENSYSNIPDKELYARAQSDSDAREALLIRVAKHQANK